MTASSPRSGVSQVQVRENQGFFRAALILIGTMGFMRVGTPSESQSIDPWIWTAGLLVVSWRIAAILVPHQADSDSELVRLAMAPLGLWFLACGVWARSRVRSAASLILALYGITGGIHWGGPIGFGPEPVQNLLLAFYVLTSTVLNQSLFLHFALAFPPESPRAFRRSVLVAVYSPVLIGTVLLVALIIFPSNEQLLGAFRVLFPIGALYSIAGGVVWFVRMATSSPELRRERRLVLILVALIASWLPHALVSSGLTIIPGHDGLVNLAMAIVPWVLAFGLVSPRRHENETTHASRQAR